MAHSLLTMEYIDIILMMILFKTETLATKHSLYCIGMEAYYFVKGCDVEKVKTQHFNIHFSLDKHAFIAKETLIYENNALYNLKL